MLYDCPRCGYDTNKRSDIEKHIFARKKLCPPVRNDIHKSELNFLFNRMVKEIESLQEKDDQLEYVCYFCPKSFSSRFGRHHHIKTCHHDEYAEIATTSVSANGNNNTILNSTGTHNTVTQNVDHSVTNIANLHIHLNPFGHENTQFVSDDDRMNCLKAGFPGLQKMVSEIFFNKEHPENHNVKLKSLKHEIILVYTVDEDWEHRHLDEAVGGMVQTSQAEIQKIHTVPDSELLQKMSNIYNPTPSQRSNTKKKITAKLVDRKEKAKVATIS